ncbi:putative Co/Zn/Cd efflux system membrane fusion protein [Rhodopirellula islandica]|uniref:Co/Zn/Cd efflux system membrane fusion protein n=1 Tax=Rhodopirellula islandica TaxID=595434 RepID=A0A0J1BN71_RHOIS|nr:HlyD family efflux transporter periplasmic adaptor subunit [Rhodopirellula islandica]KLU07916.1 putative Co/Zn/Cd efflux system membrane fusion protein [Rhodopirellula islandica]
MHRALIAAGILLFVSQSGLAQDEKPDTHESSQPAWIGDLIVTPVQSGSAVATLPGQLIKIQVAEGDTVEQGSLLASLDDVAARLHQQSAEQELAIIDFQLAQTLDVDAALAFLEEQKSAAKEHEAGAAIQKRLAENDIRVLAAQKAEAVAKSEWTRAVNAKENFDDAVSQSEIDQFKLAYEQRTLETRQAIFEQENARLEQSIDLATAAALQAKIRSAEVAVRQAEAAANVVLLKKKLKQQQLELATENVDQHSLKSPIDGIVVEVSHRVGDWVQPGEAIARVVRLDRLRVEGYLPATWIDWLRNESKPKLTIELATGETIQRSGEAKFISPEVDPLTRETRFWIEIDNTDGKVLPGSPARLLLPSNESGTTR